MYVIESKHVDDAIAKGIALIMEVGQPEDSRNGPVLVAPAPVMTVHYDPRRRYSCNPVRRANPFFHFFEALWMLDGRCDVAFPATFVKRISEFSDDDETLWGAYGNRWRNWFDQDQIADAIVELERNPKSRRVVISMWDGHRDPRVARNNGRDVPCNTHIYLRRNGNYLEMTVCCRSNDMLWGAYGANIVHFSMLQEYIAEALGLYVGVLYQMSNNFHVYTQHFNMGKLANIAAASDGLYPDVALGPVMHGPTDRVLHGALSRDFSQFHQAVTWRAQPAYETPYYRDIVEPAYRNWKARAMVAPIACTALSNACAMWLNKGEAE